LDREVPTYQVDSFVHTQKSETTGPSNLLHVEPDSAISDRESNLVRGAA